MNNKLQTIYESFREIKQVLGIDDNEQCVTVEDLPELVEEALRNSGFTTIFLFSGQASAPELPSNPTLDSNGNLSNTGDGSQDDFTTQSVARMTTTQTPANGITFARFDAEGTQVSNWSTPVDLKGAAGPKGADGKNGADGAPGSQGASGKDGNSIQYIYRLSADKLIDPPTSSENYDEYRPADGTKTPSGVTDNMPYEFVCQREKKDNKGGSGSTPSVGAHFGTIGQDGNGIEYIFCLTGNKDGKSVIPTKPDMNQGDIIEDVGYVAVGEFTGYDDPKQTDETNRNCGSCTRKQYYEGDKQLGSEFSDPVIGARYTTDGKDGGGRTVSVYTGANSLDKTPLTPSGGSGDPNTNNVVPPTSNDGFTGSIDMGDAPNGYHIWQSNCPFNSVGGQMGSGSTPVRITGKDGEPGVDGESIEFIFRLIPHREDFDILNTWYKEQNDKGNKLSSENNSGHVPFKIDSLDSNPGLVGGGQDSNGKGTICDSDGTPSPSGIGEDASGREWLIEVMCQRTFNNGVGSDGSLPTIGSMGGEDGTDGDGVEYIYCVTPKKHYVGDNLVAINPDNYLPLQIPTYQDYLSLDEYNKTTLNDPTDYADQFLKSGFVPGTTTSLHGEDGTDEPLDVSPDKPIEGVAIRKKRDWKQGAEGQNELSEAERDKDYDPIYLDYPEGPQGGNFTKPKKGAMWATDGESFKTVFAFTVSSHDLATLCTEGILELKGGNYENGFPDKCVLSNPNTTITWSDTIPKAPSETEYIGMTSRTFKAGDPDTTDDDSVDTKGSIPCKMTDTSRFQVEFSRGFMDASGNIDESKRPYPENLQKFYNEVYNELGYVDVEESELKGRANEQSKGFIGSDTEYDAVGMATCTFDNSRGSNGTVTRIKGEKGDAGTNGTSVTIKDSAVLGENCELPKDQQKDVQENLSKHLMVLCNGIYTLYFGNNEKGQYDDYDPSDLNIGDGYLVNEYLFVGDGDSGEKVGKIKGPQGDKAYFHMAFSNNPDVMEIQEGDSDDRDLTDEEMALRAGKYCGMLATYVALSYEKLRKVSTYNWGMGRGDDGGGGEQIFLLTVDDDTFHGDNGPEIADDQNVQTPDYLPLHKYESGVKSVADTTECEDCAKRGSDHPLQPDAEYCLCWISTRKARKDEYGDGSTPVLYSRYAKNASHLELTEDQFVIPVIKTDEQNSVDPDGIGTDVTALIYSGNSLLNNDVKFGYSTNGETYEYVKTYEVNGVYQSDNTLFFTRNFFISNNSINKIFIKVTVTSEGSTVEFLKSIAVRGSELPIELSVNKHVLHKNVYNGGYLIDKDFLVGVTQGNFSNNVWESIKGIAVHLRATVLDDDTNSANDIEGIETNVTDENGSVKFDDLSNIKNPTKLTVYITSDNSTNFEKAIAFEEIGVVANGEDGTLEEHIFHLSESRITDGNNVSWFKPDEGINATDYQNSDGEPNGGYDEYTDVEEVSFAYPYCYVSARKRETNEAEGKPMGGKFSTPIIWSTYSKDIGGAFLTKPAIIVQFKNDALYQTEFFNTIVVKTDKEDSFNIQNVEISEIRFNPSNKGSNTVTVSDLVSLQTGYFGNNSKNLKLVINEDIGRTTLKEGEIEIDIKATSDSGIEYTVTQEIVVVKASGESKFSVDLTNEFHYIKWGSDITAESANWPTINALAYYGTTPVSDSIIVSVTAKDQNDQEYTLKNNESVSRNSDGTYPLNIDGTQLYDGFKLPIEEGSTHFIEGTVEVKTTIESVGEVLTQDTFRIEKTSTDKVMLVVTPAVVNLQNDDTTITCKIYDGANEVTDTTGYRLKIKIGSSDEIELPDKSYTITENVEHIVSLYKVVDGTDILEDCEPITVIDVSSPYALNLSPDHDWITTDSNGNVAEGYTYPTVKSTLFDGQTQITDGATFDYTPHNCTINVNSNQNVSGEFTITSITSGTEASEASVTVKATYKGSSISKIYKMTKSFGKKEWKVVPEGINLGTVNTTFKVKVYYRESGSGVEVSYGSSTAQSLKLTVDGVEANTGGSFNIASNGTESSIVYCELKDKDDNFLDGEYLTIVKNGALTEGNIAQLNKIEASYEAIKAADKKGEEIAIDSQELAGSFEGRVNQYLLDVKGYKSETEGYKKALSNYTTAVNGYTTTVNNVNKTLDEMKACYTIDGSGKVDGINTALFDENDMTNMAFAAMGKDGEENLKEVLRAAGKTDPEINEIMNGLCFADAIWATAITTAEATIFNLAAERIVTGTIATNKITGLIGNELKHLSIYSGTNKDDSDGYIENGGSFQFGEALKYNESKGSVTINAAEIEGNLTVGGDYLLKELVIKGGSGTSEYNALVANQNGIIFQNASNKLFELTSTGLTLGGFNVYNSSAQKGFSFSDNDSKMELLTENNGAAGIILNLSDKQGSAVFGKCDSSVLSIISKSSKLDRCYGDESGIAIVGNNDLNHGIYIGGTFNQHAINIGSGGLNLENGNITVNGDVTGTTIKGVNQPIGIAGFVSRAAKCNIDTNANNGTGIPAKSYKNKILILYNHGSDVCDFYYKYNGVDRALRLGANTVGVLYSDGNQWIAGGNDSKTCPSFIPV